MSKFLPKKFIMFYLTYVIISYTNTSLCMNELLLCHFIGEFAEYVMRYWELNGYHLTYKSDPLFCVLRFWRVSKY